MAAFRSAPLFFLSLTLLLEACSSGKASPPAPAPPEVSVMTVAPETVSLSSEWIGTLDGYVNAQIRPQVSGYLLRRSYQEGALVRQGQVLFEIDPRLVRRQSSGCLSARWRIALTLSFDPLRSLSVWTTCGHRLIGPTPDDETWPFAVGDVVRCEPRLSGGVVPVACEKSP